ncbi:hypothetical protein HAZT_HAZT004031 [Hyalella azteca]|uniref:Heat shock 70 kDa protein 6-like n=1 Tax=Hyalella azteca TaxID=294128 RepID=A0A6A0HD86_HYAAZ|nr:heat shock 70 kDa protein 6-like [Hyalella azteca]KAA0203770.1 hypothetical protein HAZT_HAZT004031 [Hyalella azteca]
MMAANNDYAIGIDLGTSNSCVGVVRNGRVKIIADERGSRLTPSFVAFTDEERLIGESAKLQRTLNPANTIYEVKRLIGRKFSDEAVQKKLPHWPYRVVDDSGNPKICVKYLEEEKFFTPEEISSMVLSKMKDIAEIFLGCKVRKAVITVPAYFTDSQRQATFDAGTIAGLQVLKIINEPTAAAIAYGEDTIALYESNILIYDFGGGTFDVAVLKMKKGNYEVMSVEGNSQLGGGDIDSRVAKFMIDYFRMKTGLDVSNDDIKARAKITKAAEQTKINLSVSALDKVQIECLSHGQDFICPTSRCKFELLCADIFEETMQYVDRAITNAGLTTNEIHEVVIVGGSSWIPKLRKMLEEKFPNKEIKRTINPAEAVAYGAAVQAAMLNNDRSVEGIQLTDVTPLSLGVDIVGDRMSTIIKRNSKIPVKCTRNYTTIEDHQKAIFFKVYEGESAVASSNNLLGNFTVKGIELALAGVPSVDVTFSLDKNGILSATGVDRKTGGRGQVTISVNKGRLKKEDIERMIVEMKDMEKLKIKSRA